MRKGGGCAGRNGQGSAPARSSATCPAATLSTVTRPRLVSEGDGHIHTPRHAALSSREAVLTAGSARGLCQPRRHVAARPGSARAGGGVGVKATRGAACFWLVLYPNVSPGEAGKYSVKTSPTRSDPFPGFSMTTRTHTVGQQSIFTQCSEWRSTF